MRRLPGSLALLALFALGLIMLVPPLLGYQRYVIEGGSMGRAVPRGSIAYEEVVPAGRSGWATSSPTGRPARSG